MPYKSEKAVISGTEHDKRRKLTEEQKAEIRELYEVGDTSHRKLAVAYGVSKRLIGFILKPETLEENYRKRVENGGSKAYYDREKHTKAIRVHRRHKQDLYLDGKITIDEEE